MNIIFDLDGTLIDSSEGILQSVEEAFRQCAVPLQEKLSSKLIGPPLTELLPRLAGTTEERVIAMLSSAFKDSYDVEGYKNTEVFEGVVELMRQLKEMGHILYIATNKRILPTRKIIAFFGWRELFNGVYALDLFEQPRNKSELIAYVMNLHDMNIDDTLYIGDTLADHRAAQSNEIGYIMAMWGYDSGTFSDGWSAHLPQEMIGYCDQYQRKNK